MKRLLLCVVLLALAAPAQARTYFAEQARAQAGHTVTVRGTVAAVHDAGSATYLYLGHRGRRADLVLIVQPAALIAFPDMDMANGRTLEVSGLVQIVNGAPTLVVRDHSQLVFKD